MGPKRRWAAFNVSFLITVGALLINSAICVLLCLSVVAPARLLGHYDYLTYVLLWLGLSIGMHAFPSNQDARTLWGEARQATRGFNPLAWLSFPLVGLVWLVNLLSRVWGDVLYAAAIGLLIPELIIRSLV